MNEQTIKAKEALRTQLREDHSFGGVLLESRAEWKNLGEYVLPAVTVAGPVEFDVYIPTRQLLYMIQKRAYHRLSSLIASFFHQTCKSKAGDRQGEHQF